MTQVFSGKNTNEIGKRNHSVPGSGGVNSKINLLLSGAGGIVHWHRGVVREPDVLPCLGLHYRRLLTISRADTSPGNSRRNNTLQTNCLPYAEKENDNEKMFYCSKS